MAIDVMVPRTRRAVIAGAFGGLAAWLASALGRPLAVTAADGEPVVVGGQYSADTVTKIEIKLEGESAIWGKSDTGNGILGTSNKGAGVSGVSDSGFGVVGSSSTASGVWGDCPIGFGVRGTSASGFGAWGQSTSGVGLYGTSHADDWAAILGKSFGACTGVYGYSGAAGFEPNTPAKTGVFGYAAQDAAARGVTGQTTVGRGVYGVAASGTGTYGHATNGIGACGYATTGTAGHFSTSAPASGTALRAVGRVRFDNSAGVATIASGAKSVTVTPGINLMVTSAVVATLMGSAGGTTTVHRVIVDATADTFTIYLTANASAAVKVAWHVFG